MSLVNHHILADDGKWYNSGTLGEAKLWYICFDDDDPPELVIRHLRVGNNNVHPQKGGEQPHKMQLAIQPQELLNTRGLPFRLIRAEPHTYAQRCFPTEKGVFNLHHMYHSSSWWLEQTDVVPARWMIKHEGQPTTEMPNDMGVLYFGNEAKQQEFLAKGRVR